MATTPYHAAGWMAVPAFPLLLNCFRLHYNNFYIFSVFLPSQPLSDEESQYAFLFLILGQTSSKETIICSTLAMVDSARLVLNGTVIVVRQMFDPWQRQKISSSLASCVETSN
jgi:hypothetical protein